MVARNKRAEETSEQAGERADTLDIGDHRIMQVSQGFQSLAFALSSLFFVPRRVVRLWSAVQDTNYSLIQLVEAVSFRQDVRRPTTDSSAALAATQVFARVWPHGMAWEPT